MSSELRMIHGALVGPEMGSVTVLNSGTAMCTEKRCNSRGPVAYVIMLKIFLLCISICELSTRGFILSFSSSALFKVLLDHLEESLLLAKFSPFQKT